MENRWDIEFLGDGSFHPNLGGVFQGLLVNLVQQQNLIPKGFFFFLRQEICVTFLFFSGLNIHRYDFLSFLNSNVSPADTNTDLFHGFSVILSEHSIECIYLSNKYSWHTF